MYLLCFGVGLAEELIFRGFLWALVERAVNAVRGRFTGVSPDEGLTLATWIAFFVTSIAFAMFHMDPIQSTALIFTAFILGWLRMVSRSIWPCIVLHFVNNTLATVVAISTSNWEMDLEVSLLIAIVCGSLTLLFACLCWPFRSWKVDSQSIASSPSFSNQSPQSTPSSQEIAVSVSVSVSSGDQNEV